MVINRPYFVVGKRICPNGKRVIMGCFTERKEADKYVKELARLGALPQMVMYVPSHVYNFDNPETHYI